MLGLGALENGRKKRRKKKTKGRHGIIYFLGRTERRGDHEFLLFVGLGPGEGTEKNLTSQSS